MAEKFSQYKHTTTENILIHNLNNSVDCKLRSNILKTVYKYFDKLTDAGYHFN